MDSHRLTTFEEAFEIVTSRASDFIQQTEGCPLDLLFRRTLAEDLRAPHDLPACDNSAMDGYCMRHSDIASASKEKPATLPVAGLVMAGHPISMLAEGHAAYIATGGMLPENADCVVKIEDVFVNSGETSITVTSAPPKGTYIRKAGQDLKAGEIVLRKGDEISPFVAGMIASMGNMSAKVFRQPLVSVLTSGDEVLMPFDEPKPWQVRNANSFILGAQIQEAGARNLDLGIVRDSTEQAVAFLRRASEVSDVIVTCGGVSLGKKDPFIAAFRELGVKPLIHGISIKPGKPFFFGVLNGKPLFGLPGNQASCTVTFEILVRPFLTRLIGRLFPDRQKIVLPLAGNSRNVSGRDHFMRGKFIRKNQATFVEVFDKQDSHLLSSLVGASLLVRQRAEEKELSAGQTVECLLVAMQAG